MVKYLYLTPFQTLIFWAPEPLNKVEFNGIYVTLIWKIKKSIKVINYNKQVSFFSLCKPPTLLKSLIKNNYTAFCVYSLPQHNTLHALYLYPNVWLLNIGETQYRIIITFG